MKTTKKNNYSEFNSNVYKAQDKGKLLGSPGPHMPMILVNLYLCDMYLSFLIYKKELITLDYMSDGD